MPEAFGTGQYGLNFVGGLWFMAINQKYTLTDVESLHCRPIGAGGPGCAAILHNWVI